MQYTSIPFTLAFGPQGCMAEVKGRVVAVWCHAEWPRLFCGWVDFLQFIPHKSTIVWGCTPATLRLTSCTGYVRHPFQNER
jgi:hypothetical protein